MRWSNTVRWLVQRERVRRAAQAVEVFQQSGGKRRASESRGSGEQLPQLAQSHARCSACARLAVEPRLLDRDAPSALASGAARDRPRRRASPPAAMPPADWVRPRCDGEAESLQVVAQLRSNRGHGPNSPRLASISSTIASSKAVRPASCSDTPMRRGNRASARLRRGRIRPWRNRRSRACAAASGWPGCRPWRAAVAFTAASVRRCAGPVTRASGRSGSG